MVYLDNYGNKKFRIAFFIFLVTIFFTVAPVLILYSMGYRLDLENKKIIETGVVSIDIKPREAEVFLNNIKITKSIPIRLTNRTPGTYNLKISLSGYKTWEKNIDIKSRQTTYIKNITLLKDSLPVLIDNNLDNIELFLPSNDGRFILLSSTKNNTINIELFDSQTGEFSLIFRLPTNSKYDLEWSPFNNYILFSEFQKNNISLNILSADNIEVVKNIKINQKEDDQIHYQWQKNSPIPTIFVDMNDKIFRFTTNGNESIFNLNDNTMWYIDDFERLWVLNTDSLKVRDSKNEQDSITLANISNIEKIIDINNDRTILKTNDKIIIISRKDGRQESIQVENLRRNPYTNEWLAWSAWELWAIYEHEKPALLNRTSDNIKSVFPLDDVGTLAIINNHGIESFNPGYYVSQNLYRGDVYNAGVNKRQNKIYLFGKVRERADLYELEY